MSISNTKINPTYIGYIGSTKDALLIIQACLNNQLLTVPRRPHDRERSSLITSGNVFVFIEERSGIKRWTDGVAWSPSRILGRFLVYRELDRQALNSKDKSSSKYNEKKKFRKKSINELEIDQFKSNSSNSTTSSTSIINNGNTNNSIPNRSLVGSLVTSYAFKEYGLIKKTMSLSINRLDLNSNQNIQETIHLISYYSAEDVLNGKLKRPIDHNSNLSKIQLSNELFNAIKENSLGGKIPIEDEAFYFMDQSNPNAIALGFNPAIHLQPQYQQNKQNQQSSQQQSTNTTTQNQQPQAIQTPIQNNSFSLPPPPPPQQDLNNLPMFYQYPRYSPSIQYQNNIPQPNVPIPSNQQIPSGQPLRRHTQASISPSSSSKFQQKDISPIIKNEIGFNPINSNFLPQQSQSQPGPQPLVSQQGQPQPQVIPQGSYTPVPSNQSNLQSNLPFNSLPFNSNLGGSMNSGNMNSGNMNSGNVGNIGMQNQQGRWLGYDDNGYVGYQFGQNH